MRTLICWLSAARCWALATGALGLILPAMASAAAPVIASVAFTGTYANVTVTIKGTGFGPAPSGTPCTFCTNSYLVVRDYPAGTDWGFFNPVSFESWSDVQIVVSGIGYVDPLDAVAVVVRNPNTQKAGLWAGNIPIALWNSEYLVDPAYASQTAIAGVLP